MAATSAYLRHDAAPSSSWFVVGLAMLALAVGGGYTIAQGELVGLYVALSVTLAVAVLFDFRIGAVLMLLMLPLSRSDLFPHSLMQINGLNPLNLLLAATVGAYLISGRLRRAGPLLPKPVLWLYLAPIVVAAVIGMPNIHKIPSIFYDTGTITFASERDYLVFMLVKPVVMVAVALMIGAAAARSQNPERFIVPIAISALLIALIQLGFIILMGVPLADMASAEARRFYDPIGMHANTLGRLHLFALALLLFVWAECKQPRMKLFLLATIGILSVALLLTFSRASIGGAAVVGALFLMWRFNARSMALALLGLVALALLGGDALMSRITLGFGESADAVSAGRIEGLWLPLLPELAKSPVWGSGLGSIMWSFPMLTGELLPVTHPHNAYLETLLDLGIVGLVLMLAYYAHVWTRFRALSSDVAVSPHMRALFQGATAALCAFFVTGLVGSSLRPEAESAFLWIAIGLMYGMYARRPAK